ncbi:hypothetical protein [Anaerotignum faecicola]
MKEYIMAVSVILVLFTLVMTLYQEFKKKKHASEWALACMVLSLLNMILVTVLKHL